MAALPSQVFAGAIEIVATGIRVDMLAQLPAMQTNSRQYSSDRAGCNEQGGGTREFSPFRRRKKRKEKTNEEAELALA
jgi:hypothetical protein